MLDSALYANYLAILHHELVPVADVRSLLPLPMLQPKHGRFWENFRIPLKCI